MASFINWGFLMSTPQLLSRIVAGLVAVGACLLFTRPAQGDNVSYTIDSEQSVLNLSGTYSGFQLAPQTAGSLSDRFGGIIAGDLSGGVLSFSGGSSITAQDNGVFQPGASGASGTADGNYGVVIPSIGEFGAYRNLIFGIVSGTVRDGVAPSLTLSYASGVLDYAGPPTGPGQLNFAGVTGPDSSSALARLTFSDNTETLRLPFTLALSDASGLRQTFDGTIVGTRTVAVPEPSSLWLGIAGGAMLLTWRVRNRKL